MGKRKRLISVSLSKLQDYNYCPREYYLSRHPGLKKRTSYPKLFGIAMHSFVRRLHNPTKTPRPFYFQNLNSAIRAWCNYWERTLKEKNEQLVDIDEDKAKSYKETGIFCLIKYWQDNEGLPHPLETESFYEAILEGCIHLTGKLDQVRSVSLEWVANHRPQIIKNGKLAKEYDSVIIVDLKTDRLDFDPNRFEKFPSLEKILADQYELHEGLQPTAYTFLYEWKTGKKPIGFLWYHLRSGKFFFTYREKKDYQTLNYNIHYFLDNLNAQLFPKNISKRCKFCDYVRPCREDRYLFISYPEKIEDTSSDLDFVPNVIKKDPNRQLSLNLKIPREKRKKPEIVLPSSGLEVLSNLPWDATEIHEDFLKMRKT